MKIKSILSEISEPFQPLRNKVFARVYLSQTISLLGDAITWVGLALLAYQFGKEKTAVILATALTLRVIAFIIFSPFAGVLADRLDRKRILYTTHFIRMGLVGLLPFVTAEWQIYVLVFLMNVFNAFFSPTFRSVIPQIVDKKWYRQAIGLSAATYQLLGVLGPGLAGILAVWLGAKEIFLVDAATFIIAGILLLTLPKGHLLASREAIPSNQPTTWQDMVKGAQLLFGQRYIRFALFIELVSAMAGAFILVNTIYLVKDGLDQADRQYGWVMAAFGIGAAVAAFLSGTLDKTKSRKISLALGAVILCLAVTGANYLGFSLLLVFWIFAGFGQSLAEIPSETLIGENISDNEQGKVYGSHFAFSHLWWAISYPIAGFFGTTLPERDFLVGGTVAFSLFLIVFMVFRPRKNPEKIAKEINRT
ncbi:MFS transporter, NRE family, putaive nickel resistance protein [Flagellimonas taeanensis]|uniref:MFS transporter, NRE family, putaive nickel resistance protein n=1 Tax=Flagellimonas taeanensis TaxID=1005926 RepID=A0A1M7BBK8_9FLAO|nr:MFS transporter [Allomuricauda taeanensis]SFC39257.1 MFS transporter, NRE family, putaive nickel resistance protein [Allomuricauda taeanensis]SHL52372.1 MFS transporter, NRE family, putaive nickel resistance protein [Allomuricauda taeanensis]